MTAVEWLIDRLYQHEYHIDILDVATINGYFEQAKEMEKQQIIDAYIDRMDSTSKEEMRNILGNQYYNETYGSKGSDETKNNNMKTGTSKLMDSHLVDFTKRNRKFMKTIKKWK